MTERDEPYVLDVDEAADAYADLMVVRLGAPRAESIATFRRMIEAVRQEERAKAARWKAVAKPADVLLRAVMAELDIRPDEDPLLAVRGIIAGIRIDEREKAAQIADRLHGVGNDIIAARIREQGKEQDR